MYVFRKQGHLLQNKNKIKAVFFFLVEVYVLKKQGTFTFLAV